VSSRPRGWKPQHSVQRPLSGWPDWYDPEEDHIVVTRSGCHPKKAHVPDPTAAKARPECDISHDDDEFRAVDPAVYPDRTHCQDCPWGNTDE